MTVRDINAVPLQGSLITIEPGDSTKYRFILAKDPDEETHLLISSACEQEFQTYSYHKESLNYALKELERAPEAWGENHFYLYMQSHSFCSLATAKAALLAYDQSLQLGISWD